MSKSRRKASKEHKQSASVPVNIVLPDSLSAEEMQQIITNALLAVEDAKEQKAKEQNRHNNQNILAIQKVYAVHSEYAPSFHLWPCL